MKIKICIVCFLFFFSKVYAQSPSNKQNYADSITQVLKKQLPPSSKRFSDSLVNLAKHTKSDSLRARVFFKLGFYWRDINRTVAKKYLVTGFKYGAKYPYVKAVYYHYLGAYYYPVDATKSELNYIEADKQLSKFNTDEAYFLRAKGWGNYANLQQQKGDELLMAEILLNKCIPLIKKAGVNEFLAKYYEDLASVFMNQKQYDKAEKYFLLAIATFEKIELWDVVHLYDAYIGTTENYLYNNKITEAKRTLEKAKNLMPKCNDSLSHTEYYLAECIFYRENKAYDKSLQSANTGLKIAVKINDEYQIEVLNIQKYKTLIAYGRYQQAAALIEDIVRKNSSKSPTNILACFYDLSEVYDKMGDRNTAYVWLKKYSVLNDSLNKQEVLRKINALEIKFKTAENEKTIMNLNAENEKTKLITRNSRLANWLLALISLFLLILAIVGWFFFRNSKKLAIQKDLNHQQDLKDIYSQQHIQLVEVMLNAKEDEQNRVARDLHDGVGGMLAVSKMNLAHYINESKNNDSDLQNVVVHLENTMKELRRVAHNMMPEMLIRLGLEASLRDLCESIASDKLKVEFQCLGIGNNLKSREQINIYRIVQEAMANAAKHSNAKNLLLQCSQNKNIFFITIEDDGKGFDTSHIDIVKGIGVRNIKSRVEYLKGKIEILSQENKSGTSINIELYVTA
ncbi:MULTISPECIES: sensor histidine kinase [unclassified Pedobacter]|uniref:tetratricopeptide repeat-containing sensor histidine kinase n=1 Tax=unclassified Pedobacter TaxID=2628915 RepID=UPI00141F2AB8|nr:MULTISPECIES: sensor histidine kinase [unclassified Pedobacter]NII82612.1 signal transduction histidine kinase [Pedobacter sp. SG908]NMN36632.1 signal transduction histidine kinase [Pedobacter sp. SG918]